jgi:aspartate/methionine/tyrosine aminotransferase
VNHRYSPAAGLPALREAIAARHDVDPDREVLVTQGAMQAVNLILRTLLRRPGGNVVVPVPGFFFAEMVRRGGGEPRCVDGWDRAALAAAVDGETRAILFANPGNPTGYLPSADELRFVSSLGPLVISDESYERFVYADASRPFTSLREVWGPRAIMVRSLSKSHALADWRVGYIVAPDTDELLHALEWECLHCAHLPQVVAAAALTGPQDWIEAALAPYADLRELALEAVAGAPSLAAARPDAGPFLFVDATALPDAEAVLHGRGVPVVTGQAFGRPGFLRLPFGGERATLGRLCEVLAGV